MGLNILTQDQDFRGNVTFNSVSANSIVNPMLNSVYTTVNTGSAFNIIAGGNTRGANITIGTNDAYHFRIETDNNAKFTILSSGEVGIGTTLFETEAAGNGGLRIKNNLLVDGNTTVTGTISSQSTVYSSNRQVVTTNTTTVPGTSAVTSILAVSALPVTQETGVLYILI